MAYRTVRRSAGVGARASQQDRLFRAVADQAPQVMWIVNAEGAVTYLNHAWYELVGGTPPRWHGHEWGEVIHPEDLALMRERWKVASANGTVFEGTRRVRARDGSWRTLAFKATPVFDHRGLACWVGMDADVTEMAAAQAALRSANDELGRFAHTVAHDLRAPLMTVSGFARVLGDSVLAQGDARGRQYIVRIGQAVDHMSRLVEGLLALADVARSDMDYEQVDLSALAASILERFARTEPQRRVEVAVQEGMVVRGDSRMMAVLMENLLANAWKFTRKEPQARIAVAQAAQGDGPPVFFVRDNGAGFDMAQAGRMFEPFERLHTSAEFPGTGIGLATVARVVERHGGRVWAESAPGAGSRFCFTIPPAASCSAAPAAA